MGYYAGLKFFNKDGESLNFSYDADTDSWLGWIFMPKTSVGIPSTAQIFVVEEIIDLNGVTKYGYPHSSKNPGFGNSWRISWQINTSEEIFMYTFEDNVDDPILQQVDELNLKMDFDLSQYVDQNGILHSYLVSKNILQLNFAAISQDENIYQRGLEIVDLQSGKTIAIIGFYTEVEGEDERLKVMTENLGYTVDLEDTSIFKETDIKEPLPNFQFLNQKRKEVLLEGSKIYSHVGSYKSLINAIKFFGYDDLYLKEYWKDLNPTSPYFGKYIHTKPIELLQSTARFNDMNIKVPSSSLMKTGKFGLFYKLNNVLDTYDEHEDLPQTQESYSYSIEEVLIKLYGLKNKLQKKFLPLNAKIIDITGEADYFGRNAITNLIEQNQTLDVDAGYDVSFAITPGTNLFLKDLRSLQEFIWPAEEGISKNLVIGLLGNPWKVGDTDIYPASLDEIGGPSRVRLHGENGKAGPIKDGKTYTVAYLYDVISACFTRYAPNLDKIEELPDNEKCPVGVPITLENTTFSQLTWDIIDSSWKQLDTVGNSNIIYSWDYIQYKNANEIEWTIFKPLTDESPSYYYNVRGPIQDLNSIGLILPYNGKYTVELKIYDCFNNISSTVEEDYINVIPKNLDFAGVYTIRKENYTWSNIKPVQLSQPGVNNTNKTQYNIEDYASYWDLPLEPTTTMDECLFSWESVNRGNHILNNFKTSHPNFSIMNFRDRDSSDGDFSNTLLDSISFRGPYFWNNLDKGNWNDGAVLWWDGTAVTGDQPAYFRITEYTGPCVFVIEKETGVYKHHIDQSVVTLKELADYLNYIDDPVFSDYIYNYVEDDDTPTKFIQAVAKYDSIKADFLTERYTLSTGRSQYLPLVYSETDGSMYNGHITIGRWDLSRSSNVTWNTANVVYDAKFLPRLTHITFDYDFCKVKGKDPETATWRIINNANKESELSNIYFKNRYLTYMFDEAGEYTIELTVQDSNKNKYKRTKNILVIK